MDDVEARAAYVDGALALDVVAPLQGGGGIVLGAERAAFVAGGEKAYVEGWELVGG